MFYIKDLQQTSTVYFGQVSEITCTYIFSIFPTKIVKCFYMDMFFDKSKIYIIVSGDQKHATLNKFIVHTTMLNHTDITCTLRSN